MGEIGSRVAILGIPGSGKTTLGRLIAEKTGLPVLHLDAIGYRAGWIPIPREDFESRLDSLTAGEKWIIEGDCPYGLDERLGAADTIIYLEIGRFTCIVRTLIRMVREYGKMRNDIAEGCEDRLNLGLLRTLRWIWNYPATQLEKRTRWLEALPADKRVIRLATPRELSAFEATFM